MLTKNEIKYYSALQKKKGRIEEKKFLIEGKRIVGEGLKSRYKCEAVIVSTRFSEAYPEYIEELRKSDLKLEIIHNRDFEKLSDTDNPQGIAAVFEFPSDEQKAAHSNLIAAFDDISDPGNAGTIIRTCDWFGIGEVISSENSVDLYNSKVVRASMGSIFHLRLRESSDFINDLKDLKKIGYNILCADMNGESIYEFKPARKSVIIFSNEANGPSEKVLRMSDKILTIPRFGNAESLNVATASAVIISELVKSINKV